MKWRDASGRTALHWASVRASGATIEVLMRHGAKESVLDEEGKRPGDLFPQARGLTTTAPPPPPRAHHAACLLSTTQALLLFLLTGRAAAACARSGRGPQ